MTNQPSSQENLAQIVVLIEKLPGTRLFRNMNIARKLAVGFGLLVALTFLSAGVSYLGSQKATSTIINTNNVRVPIALDAASAQANLLSMQADVRGYLALGDQEYRDDYDDSRQAFEADLAKLEAKSQDMDELSRYRLDKLGIAYKEWAELPERLFELRDDQLDREPAYRLLVITGTQYAGEVLIDISTMIELQGERDPLEKDPALLEDMAEFQGDFAAMLSALRGYVTTRNRIYRDKYEDNLTDNQNAWVELTKQQDSLIPSQRELYNEIAQNQDAFLPLPEHLFALRGDRLDREPAYRLLVITGTQYARNVLIDIHEMIELQGERNSPEENLALLENMAEFQGNFAPMLSALRGYVTTHNRIYRGEYEANLTDNQNAWDELTEKQDALSHSQRDLYDKIAQNREAFLLLPQQIFDKLESDRWREDMYIFRTQAVPLADEMQGLLNGLVDDQQGYLEKELDDGRKSLNTANRLILASGVIALIVGLVAAYLSSATIAGPVRRLTTVAERIRTGDLDAQAQVESQDEIGTLAQTFNNMTGQLRQTLRQVRKEKKRADDLLQVVIPIGVELTTEKDFDRLLEKMLIEAQTFCHADAGTLYLRTDDDQLEFVIVRNDTHDIAIGGTTGHEIPYPPLPLQDQTVAEPGHSRIAAQVALSGDSSNIPDHNRPSDIIEDYHVTSILTIPLKNSLDKVLGVLQLLNAADPKTRQTTPFDQNLQQMMESFSSLAVAALEAYIREQGLRQEIRELRIEIDEVKKSQEVAKITESDYFQELKQRAKDLRSKSKPDED